MLVESQADMTVVAEAGDGAEALQRLNLDSRTGAELLGFLRTSVRELAQTVIMVTHDPIAASYADRVVLLADGRLAGEVVDPTADSVLDALRAMGD
jgi:putative ABC transport system ATP-binding protein